MSEAFSKIILNALFSEDSMTGIAAKLGRQRLEMIRTAFGLPEVPWISNRSMVEYVAKSPAGFALHKCWMTMEFEYDPDVDARAFTSFVKLIEYRIWFSVLDTEEIYLLCQLFGYGECPNDGIPNRKIGAKTLAPILHKMKFGTDDTQIHPERGQSPEPARS